MLINYHEYLDYLLLFFVYYEYYWKPRGRFCKKVYLNNFNSQAVWSYSALLQGNILQDFAFLSANCWKFQWRPYLNPTFTKKNTEFKLQLHLFLKNTWKGWHNFVHMTPNMYVYGNFVKLTQHFTISNCSTVNCSTRMCHNSIPAWGKRHSKHPKLKKKQHYTSPSLIFIVVRGDCFFILCIFIYFLLFLVINCLIML